MKTQQSDWRAKLIDGVPAIDWLDELLTDYAVRHARRDDMTALWDQLTLLIDSIVEAVGKDTQAEAARLANQLVGR